MNLLPERVVISTWIQSTRKLPLKTLLLILLTLSYHVSAASPPVESVEQMDAAFPDFVFVNPQGNAAKLSDYQGKVVMVKLWATWCSVCRAKWPGHQALYDTLKGESEVEVITLSVFEDQQLSQDWVDQQGFDVPLYRNPVTDRGAVLVADGSYFFIKGTPMTFLIDKNGVLRKKAVGNAPSITTEDVRSLI